MAIEIENVTSLKTDYGTLYTEIENIDRTWENGVLFYTVSQIQVACFQRQPVSIRADKVTMFWYGDE